jgi:hypothetical protein
MTIANLKDLLLHYFTNDGAKFCSPRAIEDLRLFKLSANVQYADFFTDYRSAAKRTVGYTYQIEFQGSCIGLDPQQEIGEAQVAETDTLILEVRETVGPDSGFVFIHKDLPRDARCSHCYNFKRLDFVCACQKVFAFRGPSHSCLGGLLFS